MVRGDPSGMWVRQPMSIFQGLPLPLSQSLPETSRETINDKERRIVPMSAPSRMDKTFHIIMKMGEGDVQKAPVKTGMKQEVRL